MEQLSFGLSELYKKNWIKLEKKAIFLGSFTFIYLCADIAITAQQQDPY